ncbi:chorismate mutase [Brevibacillus sp. SYP-B805]|uniref:chorismate mutase n=1 Tax=Brevibacillus sp. SYP-B805 TaxID=1578199 RepID=UPI0013EC33F0|nr:chorismate mutase [Brevibacillus sp. SYP-B805]NGQ94566.1 chorismate mutase [Brevibacillus sp. SYP-B805]
MGVRGIRGAITVEENTKEAIVQAARLLLEEIVKRNDVHPDDIASVLITATDDLDAAFPAQAARSLAGWDYVPLMCAREIPVPGSLPFCIRVMMHVNTEKKPSEIRHVFMREAVKLRPDLANR